MSPRIARDHKYDWVCKRRVQVGHGWSLLVVKSSAAAEQQFVEQGSTPPRTYSDTEQHPKQSYRQD